MPWKQSVPILQVRKLRHREVMELVAETLRFEPDPPALIPSGVSGAILLMSDTDLYCGARVQI